MGLTYIQELSTEGSDLIGPIAIRKKNLRKELEYLEKVEELVLKYPDIDSWEIASAISHGPHLK